MSLPKVERPSWADKFEWAHTEGFAVMCDFGQCGKASMVHCKDCHAYVCLEHQEGHAKTCGSTADPFARMYWEQTIIDGKEWDYG